MTAQLQAFKYVLLRCCCRGPINTSPDGARLFFPPAAQARETPGAKLAVMATVTAGRGLLGAKLQYSLVYTARLKDPWISINGSIQHRRHCACIIQSAAQSSSFCLLPFFIYYFPNFIFFFLIGAYLDIASLCLSLLLLLHFF